MRPDKYRNRVTEFADVWILSGVGWCEWPGGCQLEEGYERGSYLHTVGLEWIWAEELCREDRNERKGRRNFLGWVKVMRLEELVWRCVWVGQTWAMYEGKGELPWVQNRLNKGIWQGGRKGRGAEGWECRRWVQHDSVVRWQAGLSFSRGSCLWIPIMSVFISLQGNFPKAWIIPY